MHTEYGSADRIKEMQRRVTKRMGIFCTRLGGMDLQLKKAVMASYIRSTYEYCLPPLILAGDLGVKKAIEAEWSTAKKFLKLPHSMSIHDSYHLLGIT